MNDILLIFESLKVFFLDFSVYRGEGFYRNCLVLQICMCNIVCINFDFKIIELLYFIKFICGCIFKYIEVLMKIVIMLNLI